MSDYSYTNGDGPDQLDVNTPDGDNEPISILDDAIRQVKAYLKDPNAGPLPLEGVTEEKIANEAVSPRTLGDIAGAGLDGGEGDPLSIKVDDDTLELDGDGNLSIREVPLEKLQPGLLVPRGVAVIKDQKSAGTGGGSASSYLDNWGTITLTTIQTLGSPGVVLSGNNFILDPGSYYIKASVPAQFVSLMSCRIYNVTGNTPALIGSMVFASYWPNIGAGSGNWTTVEGILTPNVETTYRLEFRHNSFALNGGSLGSGVNFGSEHPNVFSQLTLTKYE